MSVGKIWMLDGLVYTYCNVCPCQVILKQVNLTEGEGSVQLTLY